MTVVNQTLKITGTGNGSAFAFSISPMVLLSADDLVVLHVDTNANPSVTTTLIRGTGAANYSVAVSLFPGTGTVTYPADEATPMPVGEFIFIKRLLTIEQQVNFENQGGSLAEVREQAFDRLTMIALQQQEDIDRSMKIPSTFTGVIGELDTPVGNRYVRRNSANTAWEHVAIATAEASAGDATPTTSSLVAAAAGAGADFSREDHQHLLPTITVAKGGTGAITAAAALVALGAASLTTVNTFTKTQTLVKGADLASAASLALGTDGNYFDVTGNMTIGTITGLAGTEFTLQTDDVLTLTDSATLDMGGLDIVTAAGDRFNFYMVTDSLAQLTSAMFEGIGAPRIFGKILQVVNAQTGAVATGTTTVPKDDTIPQSGEGDEYITLAITPGNALNTLLVEAEINLSHAGGAGTTLAVALFQDSIAGAIAASFDSQSEGGRPGVVTLSHKMVAGTTSAITFKMRAGSDTAGTMTFNGQGGARIYGGVLASSITIMEIAA